MSDLLVVLGSVTPPGRLLRALEAALAEISVRRPGIQLRLLNLADHHIAFADGQPPDQLGDDTSALVQAVVDARAVMLATPVYRGSFTGALKNLLDHLPVASLLGKPCGIVAMGATYHHYLGVDRHLRDVLAWFGALVAPTAVYLVSADFVDGEPQEGARTQLVELMEGLFALLAAIDGAASIGPAPLAARHTG